MCCSIPAPLAPGASLEGYDIVEWQRENLALVTNPPAREFAASEVRQDQLAVLPLLAPTAGLIADFLRRWYGPEFQAQLRIVAEIDSIYYGLALLRTGLIHGAMICAENTARAAIERRIPGGSGVRFVPLARDFRPPPADPGGYLLPQGRASALRCCAPISLLWDAFESHAAQSGL